MANIFLYSSEQEEILSSLEYIKNEILNYGFSFNYCFKVQLIIEELATNIFKHNSSKVGVELKIKLHKNYICIITKDNGKYFNLLEMTKEKEKTKGIDELTQGGRGLYLIKKYSDNIKYKYKYNQNILFTCLLLS